MSTPRTSLPDIVITGVDKVRRPSWAKHFHAHFDSWSEFKNRETLPSLTVLCIQRHGLPSKKWIHSLVEKRLKTATYTAILLHYLDDELSPDNMARVIGKFPQSTDVDFLLKSDNARTTVCKSLARVMARNLPVHLFTKVTNQTVAEERSRIDATSDLRNHLGRLSVKRVAEAFHLSVAKLASLVGTKRQTASKTDDAAMLQPKLVPYERIARLRLALDEKQFLAWLQSPNKQLGKKAPMEVIADGGVEIIADLVEDMLTGSPA